MIHILYKLDKSANHGIGLFADEDIPKGTLIYSASPLLDLNITQEQFDSLDEREKNEMRYWGFLDQNTNLWHVDFDVSKFINHSAEATTTQSKDHTEAHLVATRDIEKGEELTQNYLEFETKEVLEKRGIDV